MGWTMISNRAALLLTKKKSEVDPNPVGNLIFICTKVASYPLVIRFYDPNGNTINLVLQTGRTITHSNVTFPISCVISSNVNNPLIYMSNYGITGGSYSVDYSSSNPKLTIYKDIGATEVTIVLNEYDDDESN